MPRAAILVVLLAIAGCVWVAQWQPAYVLDRPRIMAIRSEPVELLLDGGVTLDALVYVPAGSPAPQYTWSWCAGIGTSTTGYACAITASALQSALDPDGGLGVTVNYALGSTPSANFAYPFSPALLASICASVGVQPDAGTLDAGTFDAGTFDAGTDDAGTDGGDTDGSTGAPVISAASAVRAFCSGGGTIDVLLTVAVGGDSLQAYRTIDLLQQPATYPINNPTITGLAINTPGGAIPDGGAPDGSVPLLASIPTDASEDYEGLYLGDAGSSTDDGGSGDEGSPDGGDAGSAPPAMDGGFQFPFDGGFFGPLQETLLTEGLTLSWYVEGGQLTYASTDLPSAPASSTQDWTPLLGNWWVPPAGNGTYQVILVLRGDRGGVTWWTQQVPARSGETP